MMTMTEPLIGSKILLNIKLSSNIHSSLFILQPFIHTVCLISEVKSKTLKMKEIETMYIL